MTLREKLWKIIHMHGTQKEVSGTFTYAHGRHQKLRANPPCLAGERDKSYAVVFIKKGPTKKQ